MTVSFSADIRPLFTDIDVDQRRVTVLVSFFGRETPVVLHFKQVESI